MFRRFKRMSLSSQAFVFLVLMLAGTTSALYFWAVDNAMQSELAHARTVADMTDAYRSQASKHGGFYVRREAGEEVAKVGRFLAEFTAAKALPDGSFQDYRFHQKNPFLALGDFSAEVQKSPAAAKFKMVSDNYMNPDNKPDGFDGAALRSMREESSKEYWAVVGQQLRYARALRAEPACLTCHGEPSAAPETVRALYKPVEGVARGGGYGYALGEVVGVTSVTVPHKTPMQMLSGLNSGFWVSAGFVLTLLAAAYGLVVTGLVRPLRLQSRYAERIANSDNLGEVRVPRFDANEASSKNEIHLQAHALKALHESMQAAMRHIQSRR
jgi:Protein of unknown function (DUF3365)